LSLYLRPSSDLTAVTLASLFEQLRQSDQAIAICSNGDIAIAGMSRVLGTRA
jgi:hypothetical protein